jgi:hypothetical protein
MAKTIVLAAVLACAAAAAAGAFDITSAVSLGNRGLGGSRTTPLGAKVWPLLPDWSGSIALTQKLGEDLGFSAGLERDPVLGQSVITAISYDAGFVKLTVGPFFGAFNTLESLLTSGLSTSLRLEWPGVAFASFRADSTIGAGIASPGDYVQQRSTIAAGVWLPNVVVTAQLETVGLTRMALRSGDSAVVTVDAERSRYALVADVYKKNIPYTAQLVLAYDYLSRRYLSASGNTSDRLGAAVIGLNLAATVSPTLRLSLGGEATLYAWGIGDTLSPAADAAFFNVAAGISVSIPTARDAAAEADAP